MKVNISKVILGKNKEAIKTPEGEDLTIKMCLLNALIGSEKTQGVTVSDAIMIRKLFDRIDSAEKEVELKSEEIVKLKDLSAKNLFAFVAGAVILEMEPE